MSPMWGGSVDGEPSPQNLLNAHLALYYDGPGSPNYGTVGHCRERSEMSLAKAEPERGVKPHAQSKSR